MNTYLNGREKILERQREYSARHRERDRAARNARAREGYRRNKEKCQARRKLGYLIEKGDLERPESCEKCGAACKPQAHHEDYTKPLEVRWFCSSCHGKEHRKWAGPGELAA